ncbi:MAG: ornithine cyclodeaminase family protein [Gemmataceae bacterium]
MAILLITEDEVRELLTMGDAIVAVEAGLRKLALDEGENVPRTRCRTDHAMLHVMSASAKSLGSLGFKAYSTTKRGAKFLVGLYDGKTGDLLALIQADHLGRIRTGAATGVATKYLARPEATTLGIYGTGKQARTQLLAIACVQTLSSVRVYSPTPENRSRFAKEMSAEAGVSVEPVDSPQLAAEGMDIVVTATDSREPVLKGEWLTAGVHVNAIGSNFLGKREIDGEAIRRSDAIVVDSRDQAKLEAGDLLPAIEDGSLQWSNTLELSAVLVGRVQARQKPRDITLFKSVGLAIEDVAVAARVVALAQQRKVGREIDF